jgi:hypothetical protein
MPRDYPYSIHVIESPSDLDLLEGRQEREALHRALAQVGIGIEEHLVVSKRCLARALFKVLRSPLRGGERRTIVHVAAHGTPEGIELTSGDLLPWGELAQVFRYVNELVGGRLLLGMSTCHGLHALKMVARRPDLPFGLLVGPRDEVLWTDAHVAFLAFYHLVIAKDADPLSAVAVMNAAAGLPAGSFQAIDGAGLRREISDASRKKRLDAVRALLDPEARGGTRRASSR